MACLGHMTTEEAQRSQEDELAPDEAAAILEAFLADLDMTLGKSQEAVRFCRRSAYPE